MWSADQIRLAVDLTRIDAHGVRAGMVLRVETPAAHAALWLPRLDMLTLLGTAIGVKGQGLDPTATARLQEAGGLIAAAGRRIVLAADGGIRDATVPLLRAAGAETVVMGSLAFGAPDLAERMRWLHAL
jgi:ribulose-phosphate 3-epimerase